MRAKWSRTLFLSLTGVFLVSAAAASAPTFTDLDLGVGNLNPTDAVIVQELTAQGDATDETIINALTVHNSGTADYTKIVKVEVLDGGGTIGESTALTGLTTGGVTVNVGRYALVANAEQLIRVRVTLGASSTVSGGETVALRVKFHYVLRGTTYTTAYLSDGEPETIVKGGFDVLADTAVGPFNFNPANEGIVQVATFSDDDANSTAITWQTTAVVVDNGEGTATAAEIDRVTVTVTLAGTDYVSTKTWITAGVSFTAADFTPDLPEVPDDRDITVTVTMRVKSADAMTSSGNNKTIRPRTTVNVREGEAGSQQSYTQRAVSTRIQRVRYQGFEVNEEISTALVSGVLTVGEYLTQTIRLTDDDVNGNDLELGSIEVRNTGTATGDEFSRIEVLRGGVLIGAIDDPENFAAGETFNLSLGDQVNDRGVRDNRSATLTILYHIGNGAVSGHTLKPRVRVDVLEQNVGDPRQHYWSDDVTYPNTVSLYGPGFEVVKRDPDGPAGGDAYTGQRLLAQQILCRDIDENADDVTINPIVVRNLGTASGNPDIVKIEVTDSEGRVLGEATDLTGFTSGGVSISTFVNNIVHDSPEGGLVVLLVYLTVADPEEAKTGRTINLETRILHTESGMGYEKQATGPTWTIRLNHRPVADFSHVPNIGNVREEMTFTADVTDADKDAIVSYEWTFGNGRGSGTSTEKDPKYAFPAGGRYEVTLTATDARGLSGTVTKDVVVNFAPTAGFTWEPEAPDIGVQVQFTSTVSDPDDPDDSPYTYEWDFGDDTISADANPVHSFAERRTYDVSLTVTDARGGQTTVTAELTAGNRAPVVDFTWSPTAPDENEVVTFSATVSDPDDPDDTPFTYAWTFGSIGTSTAAAPTQAFPEKKSYEVTLVVTDSRRGRTTVSKTLSVGNTPPVIGTLEADPLEPVAGETVQFAATATDADADTIEAFTWSFGDGPRGIETISGTTSHTYMTAGTYTVSVTATDSRGGVSEAKTLAIVVTGPEQIAVRAYPNPAKTQATFNYYLPNGATDPVLRVYRLDGKLVFEANLDEETAAYIWDLVADDDEKVANGLYFCVVTATDEDGKTIRSEVFRLLVTQ